MASVAITESQRKATKETIWKMAYYCETMRNGKRDENARKIANKLSGLNK